MLIGLAFLLFAALIAFFQTPVEQSAALVGIVLVVVEYALSRR